MPNSQHTSHAIAETGHVSRFSDLDIHLFREGRHHRLWEHLGSHVMEHPADGRSGTYFAVWAPNASAVSLIGDFNGWNGAEHPMQVRWDGSGIWEIWVENLGRGTIYKYAITNRHSGEMLEKGDPFALAWEVPPKTASVVWDSDYEWSDSDWISARAAQGLDRPFSVYEMHIGSWRKIPEEGNRSLSYREMADPLVEYLLDMQFTHVEFMPVMEHPFYGSWGYQVTGFFAPSSRYGTPQDFMYLVDRLHQAGIGVLLDWVPSHFPEDVFALAKFDGSCLYEHADPRKGFHPDWKSLIFNYGRHEVRAFLVSSAMFWMDRFHADGIRVDAVASMLYLDYSREHGEWEPNAFGGRENLEAIGFIKELNETLYANFPGVQTIAEESTAWPMVSRPTYMGGLGFGMKWMMGWMHDTLSYFSKEPIYRQYHQGELTFSLIYAFHENFMLPLSHDEVVHGKGSLLSKMPGDDWQQFANLRLLYAFMYNHPGTKLLFMGCEFAQRSEWSHDGGLEWNLLEHDSHEGMRQLVRDLNKVYREQRALYEFSFDDRGFRWIDASDYMNSVVSMLRMGSGSSDRVLAIGNFTPVPRPAYRVGVPMKGSWKVILNSDDTRYWGSGTGSTGVVEAVKEPQHGYTWSVELDLPPLAMLMLVPQGMAGSDVEKAAGKAASSAAVKPGGSKTKPSKSGSSEPEAPKTGRSKPKTSKVVVTKSKASKTEVTKSKAPKAGATKSKSPRK